MNSDGSKFSEKKLRLLLIRYREFFACSVSCRVMLINADEDFRYAFQKFVGKNVTSGVASAGKRVRDAIKPLVWSRCFDAKFF